MRKRQRENTPLSTLLQQLSLYSSNVPVDQDLANDVLAPYVRSAVAQEGGQSALLHQMQQFGWDGGRFTGDVHLERLFTCLQLFKYERIQRLGSGTYATVYKARNRETNEYCAVKKMRLHNENAGVPNTAIREICCLKDLRHDNIVELKEVLWNSPKSQMYVILECLNCDLREHLNASQQAPPAHVVKDYLLQILKAMAYAHSRRVMHRDLKPQNILVDSSGCSAKIKIADFGLARTFQPMGRSYSHEVVTLWYRAPELLLGTTQYTTAVDMWSIGCIFAEMLNFTPIFTGDSEIGMLHQIFQQVGTPGEENWPAATQLPYFRANFPKWSRRPLEEAIPSLKQDPQASDLLSRLLTPDPSRRISAFQALRHPWFQPPPHLCLPPTLLPPHTPTADRTLTTASQAHAHPPAILLPPKAFPKVRMAPHKLQMLARRQAKTHPHPPLPTFTSHPSAAAPTGSASCPLPTPQLDPTLHTRLNQNPPPPQNPHPPSAPTNPAAPSHQPTLARQPSLKPPPNTLLSEPPLVDLSLLPFPQALQAIPPNIHPCAPPPLSLPRASIKPSLNTKPLPSLNPPNPTLPTAPPALNPPTLHPMLASTTHLHPTPMQPDSFQFSFSFGDPAALGTGPGSLCSGVPSPSTTAAVLRSAGSFASNASSSDLITLDCLFTEQLQGLHT